MANDISSVNSSRAQQSGERSVNRAKKDSSDTGSTGSSGSSAGSSDKVSLTDTAARLKALEQQLTSQPEVNSIKVDEVKDALSNGNYKVNPERIADKMLSFESGFQK
ncbi:MAG: flagellar biosynthesis anti-sigma factor FlgM [Gammaproteobacteria bacterium]|nr:flagellar biosynthesis anti-sigma factor FlgM [Gammaproteobacteria bacterium]MDH5652969.1 flagellar biosynthesis anti-sigma factor FlgM [Gammaproteobacteria bacterium]